MRILKKFEKDGPALIFLTTPTRDLLPIFTLDELAEQTVTQLGRAASDANADILGYALLPSILYAIIGFPGTYDLPGFVYNYKWLAGRAIFALDHGEFHERLFRKGKFKPWMNRFDSLTISAKQQFFAKLDYLHNEPVRQGLVTCSTDWKYSSAGDWILRQPGPIKVQTEFDGFNLD
jgi:hypothetical protein